MKNSQRLFSALKNNYTGLGKYVSVYWEAYGGWRSFLASPFLHLAFLIALIVTIWGDAIGENKLDFQWYNIALTIIPVMLGFTLAALAAFVSFASKGFIEILAGKYKDNGASPFLETSASFFHFIFSQIIALLFALIVKINGWGAGFIDFIGWWALTYTILSAFAAALAVFHVSYLFNFYIDYSTDSKKIKPPSTPPRG